VCLPTQLTSFVGRHGELAEARKLLESPQVRLLTLTGSGGVGKTRLAIQAAAELQGVFPDGVVFVGLASINDPGLVMSAIAQALKVREVAGQSIPERLAEHVGDRGLLLVLDNFEQVLGAALAVVELLAACPRLKVLTTSRAGLHVSGEHVYPVPPLSLPDQRGAMELHEVAASEAVMLFAERAGAVDPSFALTDANAAMLAEICRRLDGLPLAIELAAARSRLLSPQVLLARLDRRLQLLKGGARDLPARQQTLRAMIDWSYDLLEAGERALFARLAIFVGGCTLEAAEAVCDLDGDLEVLAGLDGLVGKNLLQPRELQPRDGPDNDPRVLLLETIREYALERLVERVEADAVAQRHADYYLSLAEQAEPELLGARQGAWYERLEADLNNLRAALAWSLGHREAELTARLAASVLPFWISRSHANEGLRWLDTALEHRNRLSSPTLAKVLFAKGNLLLELGADHRQANTLLEESLAQFQELEDITWTVRAVSLLGWAASRAGDLDRSVALREQAVALARGEADEWNLAMALGNLGGSLWKVGDYVRARATLEESLVLYRALGEPEGTAFALCGLGMVKLSEGDYKRASSLLEEALALARKVGHLPDTGRYLADLGVVVLHEAEYDRAVALFEESLRLAREVEDDLLTSQCLWGMAVVAAAQGRPVRAACLWGAAAALRYALVVPSVVVRPLEQRLLVPVRDRLDSDTFDAAWAKGQAMRREDAIAYALVNDDEAP
jgi:predicted ATPase